MADKKTDSSTATFHNLTGLWTGKGKVAFSGRMREDASIPKGAKLLAFRNPNATPENRQPTYNLCWVIDDENNN